MTKPRRRRPARYFDQETRESIAKLSLAVEHQSQNQERLETALQRLGNALERMEERIQAGARPNWSVLISLVTLLVVIGGLAFTPVYQSLDRIQVKVLQLDEQDRNSLRAQGQLDSFVGQAVRFQTHTQGWQETFEQQLSAVETKADVNTSLLQSRTRSVDLVPSLLERISKLEGRLENQP